MDGVFAMQDYYAKGGFVFSHRNMRFRAEITERPTTSQVDGEDIVPLADVPVRSGSRLRPHLLPRRAPELPERVDSPSRCIRPRLPARRAG